MEFKNVLLAIFIAKFVEIYAGQIKCSKIYVIPLFAENSICSDYYYDESCIFTLKIFLGRCGSKKKNPRKMLSIFNFNYETVYTCIISRYIIYSCDMGYNNGNNVTLMKNNHSSIWPQIERQIKMDKQDGCYENSLALFLTDIPCQDYKYYPNMMELFGFGLNNTMEKLLDLKLHAYAVWLYNPNKTENLPCNDMKNLAFTDSNNLETHHMFFNDLIQDKGLDLLCTTDNFPKPRGTLKSPDYTALTVSVSIGCGVIFALILLFVAFWSRQIYRRWQENKIEAFADAHAKSARHLLFGKYLDEWEVTPKELRVEQNKVLGKGAFATVYKGHLKKMRNDVLIEMDVAAKFPHIDANQKTRQDMISEIGFMKTLGTHENLLVMIGYVKSIENPVICTHYCSNGDLLKILQKHELHFMTSNKCAKVPICLILPDLLRISIEVCNGLCYLSSLNYIHRDIAARNVLLTENMTAKLGDFGLCKKLENGHDFLIDKEGKLPIKHMSYEAIKFGRFSEKSDVWSFGVLMWEMLSGGKKPFENMDLDEFINFLESNEKIEFPKESPVQLVQILENYCFQNEPDLRINFVELKEQLTWFYKNVI